MKTEDRYCFCPNGSCPHIMTGEQGPDGSAGMYVLKLKGSEFPPQCPYCGMRMTAQCRGCGRRLDMRPLRYCPSCGEPLLNAAAKPAKCVICGKPVQGQGAGQLDVPLCSERCIGTFIQQNVRVCDQCGKRFKITDPEVPDDESPSGREHDFCSRQCQKAFHEQRTAAVRNSMA